MRKLHFCEISLKIILLKLLPDLPKVNELKRKRGSYQNTVLYIVKHWKKENKPYLINMVDRIYFTAGLGSSKLLVLGTCT